MAASTYSTYKTGSPYVFKRQLHSSHSLVSGLLPQNGDGRSLLDVGCADGYLARLFAARGFSVTAIDAPAAQTPAFPAGIQYLEADLDRGLPPIGRTFDFIVCADVLEHLQNPDLLLRHIRSALSPGGKLIASLPNSANIYFRLKILTGKFPSHDRGLFDRTHLHYFTWSGWNGLLIRNRLKIVLSKPSVIPFSLVWPRLPRLTAALESIYSVAASVSKTLFAYQFIVVAEK